jgi:hypothetical protein
MTKIDYVLIAKAIREVSSSNNADKDTLRMLICNLHAKFQKDNSKYLGSKFEKECGLTTNI